MAKENGSSNTAVVAIIVIVLIAIALFWFYRGASERGALKQETNIESPSQVPSTQEAPSTAPRT